MSKTIRRLTALLLSLLLITGVFAPAAFAAPALPQGYTSASLEALIPKAETLLGALMKQNPETADLSASVYGALCSDATLNAMFSGIYGGFSENASTLQTLGIDISVPRLAEALSAYPGVSGVLQQYNDWPSALQAVNGMRWGVTDKNGFADAAAAMLSPLNELLFTLLCSGTYNVNVLIGVKGADGYQNAVQPLLRTLGCPDILPQADYTAAAEADRGEMVRKLFGMVFKTLDLWLSKPVDSLTRYLPPLADYLNGGGLSDTLKTLMEPLQVRVALFSLSGVNDLLKNTDLFSSPADLTSMLEKADLGSALGMEGSLKLPKIDLAALAACGTKSGDTFTADRGAAFAEILRWACEALRQNQSLLSSAGGDAAALKSFTDQSTDKLVLLILKVLGLDASPAVLQYTWTYPAYTPGTAAFTANLTRENYEKILREIDPTLNEFLTEFTDKGTLTGLVKQGVYANKTVTMLVKTLYGALDSEQTAGAAGLLGLPVSPSAVAASIRGKFPSAARAIAGAAKWETLGDGAVSWGFKDGDKTGFTNTLIALLKPFAPYLRFLLAEGSITLLGALTVGGGNGYDTAVLPILEGLGCDPGAIVSYSEYKRGSDEALITNILTPVTALIDQIAEAPVATVCALGPNLVYFMNSGALKQCMENLLYPVKTLTDKLGISDLLPADLTAGMGDLPDVPTLLRTLTEGSDLGIELPDPDLGLLQSLGTAESRPSKRGGGSAQFTYIEADAPLVLVTVLRYILGAVKNGGDPAALTKLMGSGEGQAPEGAPDMMAMYAEKVGAQLAEMSVDDTIEWLYDLLFSETPKRETVEGEEIIPTVIYQKTPDHTTRNRILVGLSALAVIVGVVIFAAKFDFAGAKERRARKKKKKLAALSGAAAEPVSGSGEAEAGKRTRRKTKPEKQQALAQRRAQKNLRLQEQAAKRALKDARRAEKAARQGW